MRKLHPRQVAQQCPVGMQGTFGRTGRTRGVNNQRRIIGSGFKGPKIRRCLFNKLPKIQNFLCFFAASYDNQFKLGKVLPNLHDFWQVIRIGDNPFGFAVGQPVFEGIDAKKGKKRNRNRAYFVSRNDKNSKPVLNTCPMECRLLLAALLRRIPRDKNLGCRIFFEIQTCFGFTR
jgi:hypothetical protein